VRNWSETVRYSASRQVRPASLEQLRDLVSGSRHVKALGSRHSFNDIGDTPGVQIALDEMPRYVDVSADRGLVTCNAGLTHSELSLELEKHGLALPNLASLPHISVGGAIQTGTHGSGSGNAALSANVESIEIVTADGDVRLVRTGDRDFNGVVVGLGAFGVVHRVTQRCVPSFRMTQTVHENLPWATLLPRLEEVMASAYSVSLFTRYDTSAVAQVWVKSRAHDPASLDLAELGATAATRTLHPLPDTPSDNVTEQLGAPGASHERLPHFRHGFKPGRGDEIQSEYLVAAGHGAEAIDALRAIGSVIAPVLHVAELRRVAPDDAWLSPSSGRDSLALHFTWQRRPEAVAAVLPRVEDALEPFGARPHWGKLFAVEPAKLRTAYAHFDEFVSLLERWDPDGTFDNPFLQRLFARPL